MSCNTSADKMGPAAAPAEVSLTSPHWMKGKLRRIFLSQSRRPRKRLKTIKVTNAHVILLQGVAKGGHLCKRSENRRTEWT